jgi:hypothetical protein
MRLPRLNLNWLRRSTAKAQPVVKKAAKKVAAKKKAGGTK